MNRINLHEQAELDDPTRDVVSRAAQYMELRGAEVIMHSTEEYLMMLLAKGIEARINGNYGIAASLIFRKGGKEVIVFGQNSLVSEGNPHGHAEMNAVKNAWRMNLSPEIVVPELSARGLLLIRDAPHDMSETMLVTTLEPCPMCTVGAVINARMQSVIIGTEDPYAGALEPSRLASLPPLWNTVASQQGLNVVFAQSKNASDLQSYAPSELLTLLSDLFFQTKAPLDEMLANSGFVDFGNTPDLVTR